MLRTTGYGSHHESSQVSRVEQSRPRVFSRPLQVSQVPPSSPFPGLLISSYSFFKASPSFVRTSLCHCHLVSPLLAAPSRSKGISTATECTRLPAVWALSSHCVGRARFNTEAMAPGVKVAETQRAAPPREEGLKEAATSTPLTSGDRSAWPSGAVGKSICGHRESWDSFQPS